MPAVAVCPWLLTPVLFCCTGGHGCNAHPAFPAPSVGEGGTKEQNSDAFVPRERGTASPSVSCPASCEASSMPRPLGSSTCASGILERPGGPGDDDREWLFDR